MGHRQTKKNLESILALDTWREQLASAGLPPAETMGPLFALLLHRDELIRWRAVEAFGVLLPQLAEKEMESARRVMRMMLWRMNEESGNVGWGVAEAMGAAMAGHAGLAKEYHGILLSYVRENAGGFCHGNFIDNPVLRRGAYWGVARLAQARPELVGRITADLVQVLDPGRAMEGREGTVEGMNCHDAPARVLASLALGFAGGPAAQVALAAAAKDNALATIYWDGNMQEIRVADAALKGMKELAKRKVAPV